MCELQGGVLVLGCGPVGLFAMWSAWVMGAGRIIAVDHVDYRLDFARRWLGVETLNFREVDLRYMPHLPEHIQAGRIRPQEVFTHRLPLERAAA